MNKHKPCECDYCKRISPMWDYVSKALSIQPELLKDFEWFMEKSMYDGDELCCANAKLEGIWPGWEWMKGNKGEPMVDRNLLIDTFNMLKQAYRMMSCVHLDEQCDYKFCDAVQKELDKTKPLYPQ